MPRQTRPGEGPPVAIFHNGPLAGRTRPKTAAGRWPAYLNMLGEPVRIERGRSQARRFGNLYVLNLRKLAPLSAPTGSKVYEWLPPRVQPQPTGATS